MRGTWHLGSACLALVGAAGAAVGAGDASALVQAAVAAGLQKTGGWHGHGKEHSKFSVGDKLELQVPLSAGSMAWVGCSVSGRGAGPDTYNVHVPGAPEELQNWLDLPAQALRRPLPEEAPAAAEHPLVTVQRDLADSPAFNCAAKPLLCKPPFSCETYRPAEALQWFYYGAARGGTNPRLVCAEPQLGFYAVQCLAKRNLTLAAQSSFLAVRAGLLGPGAAERQASLCFIEGHCANTALTSRSGPEQAKQFCTERYGAERWAHWRSVKASAEDSLGYGGVPATGAGFSSMEQTTPFSLKACASGTYHCDVVTCKQTYCQVPKYRQKYGHLLSEYGWA